MKTSLELNTKLASPRDAHVRSDFSRDERGSDACGSALSIFPRRIRDETRASRLKRTSKNPDFKSRASGRAVAGWQSFSRF
jgi:hypothetical protein